MSFHGHEGDDQSPAPAPLDLLDEYWFFSNTLQNRKKKLPSTTKTKPPVLLRSPSLPPHHHHVHDHVDEEEELVKKEEEAEVDDDDLNWSSIYEGVLRTRMEQGSSSSSLQRAPSMPAVPSSSSSSSDHHGRGKEKETPISSNNKLRHSYSTLERHCRGSNTTKQHKTDEQKKQTAIRSSKQQQQPNKAMKKMMARSKSAFLFHPEATDDKRKKKSSSDLESMEVQGFKDLGFVFDKEELRENLADVLPGLKNTDRGSSSVRRPYLSEAWHHDRWRSAPPALIRVQSETRSAAEMKDQLRMWAQAVACNVRQECV